MSWKVGAARSLAHRLPLPLPSLLPSPACRVRRPSVLQDVISTMFSEKFISELFKPQKMYSSTSTRQIFDRLAHSSIMRLNTSSMDKVRQNNETHGAEYSL